jgi:hypothetical protein
MPKLPPNLIVAIWTLRSVPITMALLTMLSTAQSNNNALLWINAIGLAGIIAAIFYLDHMQRLSWPVGQAIYIYVFVALILQDPHGVLQYLQIGRLAQVDWQNMVRLLWVIASIVIAGLLIEALVAKLSKLQKWAWWLSMGLSLVYILSLIFFLPGTLSLWCLYNWETRDAFKKRRITQLD